MERIVRRQGLAHLTIRDTDFTFRGKPMTTLVRAAALTCFPEVAQLHGLDARALVREAGLPARCLEDPDLKVPSRLVADVLELAASRSGDAAFGVRMAQSRRLSNLGVLGLLVRDAPTLREALEGLMHHMHVHNEALVVRVEQVGNLVAIREELIADGARSVRQAAELIVGVTFRFVELFMVSGWRPRLVCFSHRAPASLAVHRQLFGRAIEFGHEFNGIVCNAADLEAVNPGADPVMARYAQQLVRQQGRTPDFTARVHELAVLLLPRGSCRVETVAHHLAMDRRTVARHLAAEGTSFSAVVQSLRQELLDRYLAEGAQSLTTVSALLGFSSPSAFSRWHRERFGVAARSRSRA